MVKCSKCGTWCYVDQHVCPPAWEVWQTNAPDEPTRIYAQDAEMAARKWADRYDSDSDRPTVAAGEEEPTICVRPDGDGDVTRWRVTGELVPQYYARQVNL